MPKLSSTGTSVPLFALLQIGVVHISIHLHTLELYVCLILISLLFILSHAEVFLWGKLNRELFCPLNNLPGPLVSFSGAA